MAPSSTKPGALRPIHYTTPDTLNRGREKKKFFTIDEKAANATEKEKQKKNTLDKGLKTIHKNANKKCSIKDNGQTEYRQG